MRSRAQRTDHRMSQAGADLQTTTRASAVVCGVFVILVIQLFITQYV